MEIIEIIGITGLGMILLTFIIMLIRNWRQNRKEIREMAKRDKEWQSRPDYIKPSRPLLITRSPSRRQS